MVSYNSSDVVQCLRQYEMFANSLKLVKNTEQREMIIKQLTKLEEKIIALTNEAYEEEYYTLANKECGLLDDEKNRVNLLIDLINQRLSYIEKRCNNHYSLTGESINVSEVVGADKLDEYENRVRVIDKYVKNIKLEKELNEEVKSLTNKIALASEKIDINKSLNLELEATFKKELDEAFQELHLYDLLEIQDDIEYAYEETEKSLTLAELNLETAKTSPINILNDCQEMYDDIVKDYNKYRDQISLIKLMNVYNREVENYDELLNKRKEINEIIKYIKNQEFLNIVMDMISKQFNTITMEGQDINTYNDLVLEKDRKINALKEIDEENNSQEFQSILKELIENEKKRQEKILEEQRKIEEEEKKKRLEIERKRQEEILKRQRIIEEARKKEIEKRTKQMLEEQHNSLIQNKKKDKAVSFETIKDNTLENEENKEENLVQVKEEKNIEVPKKEFEKFNLDIDELNNQIPDNSENDNFFFKNKVDIEKELFDEFNKREKPQVKQDEIIEPINNSGIAQIDREEIEHNRNIDLTEKVVNDSENTNKFPDMSIDEYMKNFNASKVDNVEDLFGDDAFPSIPM